MRVLLVVLFILRTAIAQDFSVKPANATVGSSSKDTMISNEGEANPLPAGPRPQKQAPPAPGFWDFGDYKSTVPLRTNSQIFHDHLWQATQGIWLSSIVYDTELTHQGLAHHKCIEKGLFNNPHPSRWQLYRSTMPEYLVGTGFNYLMMRYVSKSLILGFPAMGTKEHIEGGTQWFSEGCW